MDFSLNSDSRISCIGSCVGDCRRVGIHDGTATELPVNPNCCFCRLMILLGSILTNAGCHVRVNGSSLSGNCPRGGIRSSLDEEKNQFDDDDAKENDDGLPGFRIEVTSGPGVNQFHLSTRRTNDLMDLMASYRIATFLNRRLREEDMRDYILQGEIPDDDERRSLIEAMEAPLPEIGDDEFPMH